MMMNKIGIDIGGTNIRVGVVSGCGKILSLERCSSTEGIKTVNDLLNRIIEMTERLPNIKQCISIGVGVPGMIVNNKILHCRNLMHLNNFNLKERLEKYFKMPVQLENDAKVAALGEALVGAGKGESIVAYVGLGTGLGGGVVIDKNIYLGASNLGGYFSRIILDGEQEAEHLVTGTALHKSTIATFGSDMRVRELFALAKTDKKASVIIEKFKKDLCNLLINISVTINPSVIVLGGGVMESSHFFLDDIQKTFKAMQKENYKDTKIVKSTLEFPGVVGAAMLVK
ncbi:MAG: ROK family protein [Firmicutes bacterium]|nr:ROK family protein [Bacillota bacterium]